MHGYEIQQMILENGLDQWTNVLSGSIYYALNKMEKEGLVETVAEERTGARLRKIYGITTMGEQTYEELILQSLKQPPFDVQSNFMVGISLIEKMDDEKQLEVLEQNLEQLQQKKIHWEQGYVLKQQYLDEHAALAFKTSLHIIDTNISFIEQLILLYEKKAK